MNALGLFFVELFNLKKFKRQNIFPRENRMKHKDSSGNCFYGGSSSQQKLNGFMDRCLTRVKYPDLNSELFLCFSQVQYY